MEENKIDRYFKKYQLCIDFLKFEATTLWQIFNAFLIGNNLFVGFLIILLKKENNVKPNFVLLLLAGIVGLTIAILWLVTFNRNSDWYKYRMQQAKDAEKEYVDAIEDQEWYLLNKDAEIFAESNNIKGLKNYYSAKCMILIFFIIYIGVIWYSVFNVICNC